MNICQRLLNDPEDRRFHLLRPGQRVLVFCRDQFLSPLTYAPLCSVRAFPTCVGSTPGSRSRSGDTATQC